MKSHSLWDINSAADVYRRLFHSFKEAIIVADTRSGAILDCNTTAETLTGWSRTDLLGKHITFLCDDDKRDHYIEIFKNHVRSGQGQEQEVFVRHSSGRSIPVLIEAQRITLDQGDVLVGVFTELSKIHELREQLEHFEDRYRLTIDALTDIIHVIDKDYRVILVNQSARAYQLRLELPLPMEGGLLWEVYPFLGAAVRNEYDQVFNTRRPLITTESITLKGKILHTVTHKMPLVQNNQATHVVTVIRDVTEQVKADAAMKEHQVMLNSIFRSAPTGIGAAVNQIIQWVNDRFTVLTGYSREEICGQHLRILYPSDEEYERVGQKFTAAFQRKKIGCEETLCRRKDGTVVNILLRVAPINPENHAEGVTFSALDITGRKEAEKNLRESEERFRLMAENLPGVVYLCHNDEALSMIFTSEAVKDFTGYTPEDFYQSRVSYQDLCHWDDRESIRQDIDEATRRRRPFHLIYRLRHRDGSWRWVEEYGSGVYRDEHAVMLEGYINDISDRMKAEQSLQQSEAKFRSLYESVQAGVMVLNAQGLITHVNQVACRVFGMEEREIFGKTTLTAGWKLLDDSLRPIPSEQYPSMITFRTAQPIRNVVLGIKVKSSPQVRWLLINTEPIFDQITHKIREVIVTFADITRRREAEELLRREKDLAQNYLDIAGVLLVALDARGRITMINRRGCSILDRTQEQLLGKDWFECCIPDVQRRRVRDMFDRLMAGKIEVEQYYENNISTASGAQRIIAWYNSLLRDESGTIIGTLSSGEDITERKGYEQRLLDYQKQLRDLASQLTLAEESQRQRVATELHDHIGQNLALSTLKLDSVRHDMPSGLAQDVEDACELVRQAMRDTRNLIFDLGSPTLYTSGFEDAVEDWLAEQLQGVYHIAYQFSNDSHPKPLEEQNKILLFRAVREVLVNIIKHARARKVTVDIRRMDDKIIVTIQDDGVGFDAEKIMSAGGSGSRGFGLFSLRERLDHMGGRFEVASHPGQGTRVELTAPLSSGPERKEPDT